MDLLFLIFNAFIFIQYTFLLSHWGITRSVEKYLFAFLLLMVQIIGTLLFLGAIGYLYPLPAIGINTIIILSLMLFVRPKIPENLTFSRWHIWNIILTPFSNKLILGASIIILGWLLLCAYFLPPREVDDMTYHIPFIYESIQRGHWALLPTKFCIQFAYPMNAEVLYSWQILFLGNTHWVTAAQIPLAVWTAGIIYLFGRHFGIRRAKAFFLAGIFFLTPIVIEQMGTDYIDLTSAGFLLSSLYLTVRFLVTSGRIYAQLAFLSIGTMMGIKYHLLIWGILLSIILLSILIRKGFKKDFIWGFLTLTVLGLGWHLKNFLLFSNWLYPAQVTASYWGIRPHPVEGIFISIFKIIYLIFIKYINNGTMDGGFGFCYSLIIFLSVMMYGWKFLFRRNRWIKGELLFFGIMLSFLIIISIIGNDVFPWIGSRILLVAWPLFLLIFGRILFILNKKPWFYQLIITLFFLGFIHDIFIVVTSPMPHHHWWKRLKTSPFESYNYSSWYIPRFGPCASKLDVLTQHLSRQATVYIVAPTGEFFSAPFYGSYLQAQIINFDPEFKDDPDFLVYLPISPEPLVYVGKYKKTLDEAISSNKYKEIFSSPDGKIFANTRLLKLAL